MNVPVVIASVVGLFALLGIWTWIESLISERKQAKKAKGRQEILDAVRQSRSG